MEIRTVEGLWQEWGLTTIQYVIYILQYTSVSENKAKLIIGGETPAHVITPVPPKSLPLEAVSASAMSAAAD